MENPFNYLQFATGDRFYDREEIRKDVQKVYRKLAPVKFELQKLGGFLKSIRPKLTLDASGEIGVVLGLRGHHSTRVKKDTGWFLIKEAEAGSF